MPWECNLLDLYSISRTLVENFGASTKGRPKPLADVDLDRDVLYFLWVCDEYVFEYSRLRIQLAFAVLLLVYLGLRPGDFTESSAWRKSNEDLIYKDIELSAILCKDGLVRLVLKLNIKNRKKSSQA